MGPGTRFRGHQPPGQQWLVASNRGMPEPTPRQPVSSRSSFPWPSANAHLDLTSPIHAEPYLPPVIEVDEFAHPELLRPGEFTRVEYLDHKLALRRSQLQQQEANLDVLRAQRANPRVIAEEQAAVERTRFEINAKTYRVLRKKVERDIHVATRHAKRRRLLQGSGGRPGQYQQQEQMVMSTAGISNNNLGDGYYDNARSPPNRNLAPSCAGRIGPYMLSLPAPPGCAPRMGRYYVSQPASPARAGSVSTHTLADRQSMAIASWAPTSPSSRKTAISEGNARGRGRRFVSGVTRRGWTKPGPTTVHSAIRSTASASASGPLQAVRQGSARQQQQQQQQQPRQQTTRKRGLDDAFSVQGDDGSGGGGGYGMGEGGPRKLFRI